MSQPRAVDAVEVLDLDAALLDAALLDEETLEAHRDQAEQIGRPLSLELLASGAVSSHDFAALLSERLGLPVVGLPDEAHDEELDEFPFGFARNAGALRPATPYRGAHWLCVEPELIRRDRRSHGRDVEPTCALCRFDEVEALIERRFLRPPEVVAATRAALELALGEENAGRALLLAARELGPITGHRRVEVGPFSLWQLSTGRRYPQHAYIFMESGGPELVRGRAGFERVCRASRSGLRHQTMAVAKLYALLVPRIVVREGYAVRVPRTALESQMQVMGMSRRGGPPDVAERWRPPHVEGDEIVFFTISSPAPETTVHEVRLHLEHITCEAVPVAAFKLR